MGWCHEFGDQINSACGHPMLAATDACSCQQCGTVCAGRFDGCAAVWARGPREPLVVTVAAEIDGPADAPVETSAGRAPAAALAPPPDTSHISPAVFREAAVARTVHEALSLAADELGRATRTSTSLAARLDVLEADLLELTQRAQQRHDQVIRLVMRGAPLS
jgi:hypothetical protein